MSLAGMLRTALAGGVVVADTLVCAPAAVLAGVTAGPGSAAVDGIYRTFARTALAGFRATVRSAGAERLARDRRYVLVANHQSHLDALAILVALPHHPLRFVAKKELASIPLFGDALRYSGNVFVSRSDTREDLERLESAQRELLERVSVLFFAEGTRSATGALGAFKRGAAVFALRSGLDLVPIGVHGSFEIYARGLDVKRGGPIGISIGEPIRSVGRRFEERGILTDELREAVAHEIERARGLVSSA